MQKVIRALQLEIEALYHIHLKSTLAIAGFLGIALLTGYFINHNNTAQTLTTPVISHDSINYSIDVGHEYSDSVQNFFATNNAIEKIFADDLFSKNQEEFGAAIAFADENTLAVSSVDLDSGLTMVYILQRTQNDTWQIDYSFSYEESSATNYKIPSTETPADSSDLGFGAALAFYDNNTLAIGAPTWQGPAISDDTSTEDIYEADDGTHRGAVYIFKKNNDIWDLSTTVRGFDAQSYFGSSLAFSPSGTLAIGAAGNPSEESGCPDGPMGEEVSVPANEDIDNDGDIDEDDTHKIRRRVLVCPSVHIYEAGASSQWIKTSTISSESSILNSSTFGGSLNFADDNLLAIGAPFQYAPRVINGEGYTRRPGAVHLYEKDSNGDWQKNLVFSDFYDDDHSPGKYQIELDELGNFGSAVAFINPDTLAVSAYAGQGIYVFQKSNSVWSQLLRISKDDPSTRHNLPFESELGRSIAFYGDILAVTSTSERKEFGSNHKGAVSLLTWSTFTSETTWHYTYIDDAICDEDDFSNTPNDYSEGETITPPASEEGKRLCFKADDGVNPPQYFASDILDLTAPGLDDPELSATEDGLLNIHFNEKIRQIDDSEIDEEWVRENIGDLNITIGDASPLVIPLNHTNSGNSLVAVEHTNDKTTLRIQVDVGNTNFPPATPPTATNPHLYEITLNNFEDFSDNAQEEEVTASQEITGYSGLPLITITLKDGQILVATDNISAGISALHYVFLDQGDLCDATTDFSLAAAYTEGNDIRLEESHNGQQICFRDINTEDASLVTYATYSITDVDRTAPLINLTETDTTIAAATDATETISWEYVILDGTVCDGTTDFSSATTYTEGTEITVDRSPSSTQLGKTYCFKAADNKDNVSYKASASIGDHPRIEKITVGGSSRNLVGVGQELTVQLHFNEAVVLNGGHRGIYLHLNSQTEPNSLNGYREQSSDLENGIFSFYYLTQIDDYTEHLKIIDVISKSTTIEDLDGNPAILDFTNLNIVDLNDQPRIIKVDGRKPTITTTYNNADTWSTTKTISAIDDEANNDLLWDYYFFDGDDIVNFADRNPYYTIDDSLEIRCYLGDFLPEGTREGTAYTEGTEIELTGEHNGQYICLRSRRSQEDLWDRSNDRDRAGAIVLLQNLDSTPPAIALNNRNQEIEAVATDFESGLAPNTLRYKIVETSDECTIVALETGTTTYVNPIPFTSSHEGKYFCFGAEDVAGNTGHAHISSRAERSRRPNRDNTPPNIIVNNPSDNTQPAGSKTVSATSDSTDVVDSSWIFKMYDADENSCDEALMAEGVSAYRDSQAIVLNDESHNGQNICFSVSDEDDNIAYNPSDTIEGIDRTAPTIAVTMNGSDVSATDDEITENPWYYIITTSNTCDSTTLIGARKYIEDTVVDLSAYANHRVCFQVTDNADNTNYQGSNIFVAPPGANGVSESESTDSQQDEELQNDESPRPNIGVNENSDDGQNSQLLGSTQNNSSLGRWLSLLALIGALMLLFFFIVIYRRKDDDEETRQRLEEEEYSHNY